METYDVDIYIYMYIYTHIHIYIYMYIMITTITLLLLLVCLAPADRGDLGGRPHEQLHLGPRACRRRENMVGVNMFLA